MVHFYTIFFPSIIVGRKSWKLYSRYIRRDRVGYKYPSFIYYLVIIVRAIPTYTCTGNYIRKMVNIICKSGAIERIPEVFSKKGKSSFLKLLKCLPDFPLSTTFPNVEISTRIFPDVSQIKVVFRVEKIENIFQG